eukprot:COSAG06_NODE_41185_length_394_cov_0.650847_1_plen_118_part_10
MRIRSLGAVSATMGVRARAVHVVMMAALAARGAAQDCTAQDNCDTDGASCSLFLSNQLACDGAAAGYYLFRGEVVQQCAAVDGAASVTCDAADDSRAVCASLSYHHTDNTGLGVSDTC